MLTITQMKILNLRCTYTLRNRPDLSAVPTIDDTDESIDGKFWD